MSNSAMLVTRYLPERLKRNLTHGLEARWLELQRDGKVGYTPGAHDPRVDALISDARQAYALGITLYLPEWAKESGIGKPRSAETCVTCNTTHKEDFGEQQGGIRGGSSTHDGAHDNQRRAGRVGPN